MRPPRSGWWWCLRPDRGPDRWPARSPAAAVPDPAPPRRASADPRPGRGGSARSWRSVPTGSRRSPPVGRHFADAWEHRRRGTGSDGRLPPALPASAVLRRPDGRRGRGDRPHPGRPARGGPRRPRRPRRGVHPTRDRRPALPRGGGSGGPPRQPQPHRVVAGNGVADPVEGARQHGDRAQRAARAVGLDARPADPLLDVGLGLRLGAEPVEARAQRPAPREHQRARQGQRPRLRHHARRRGAGVAPAPSSAAVAQPAQRGLLRVRHRDVRPRPRRVAPLR